MTTKITSDNIDTTIGTGAQQDTNVFNIGLLGFKIAVNEGLTVFNLIDGVVDEFNDESGTDESEGSNDLYCATSDFYQNLQISPASFSAGFASSTITEPDTSTAQTPGTSSGSFTVPCGMTSANIKMWGAGGSSGGPSPAGPGGGGGYVEGTLAVTAGQVLDVYIGDGGNFPGGHPQGNNIESWFGGGCYTGPNGGNGGGIGLVSTAELDISPKAAPLVPSIAVVAGAGGGGGPGYGHCGGAGGGLTGCAAESSSEQTGTSGQGGGGGSQTQGGQAPGPSGQNGSFLEGGEGYSGGGAGYYGGAGGSTDGFTGGAGGGGSSYYGHPQITSGSTEEGNRGEGGGVLDPAYVDGTNEGTPEGSYDKGEDGYVLITGTGCAPAPGGSSTIVSTSFTSNSVATSARIVVFEEDVDSPTLNTDIIASVSRDGGSNYTNATLSDSGYVTGTSGQRILTGQADISGQPSGQSMRWKLALANNTVKIHGVALQWS